MIIHEFVFIESFQVHVSDRVDGFGFKLSVSLMSPSVLEAFHVPLVHHGNNGLSGKVLVDVVEDIILLLVDEDSLLVGRDLLKEFDVPGQAILVKGFCKALSSQNGQCPL